MTSHAHNPAATTYAERNYTVAHRSHDGDHWFCLRMPDGTTFGTRRKTRAESEADLERIIARQREELAVPCRLCGAPMSTHRNYECPA